jgi:hypothetical protein
MSVSVSSVLVLSCIVSGLATGWSPIQGVQLSVSSVVFRLIPYGNRPVDLILQGRRRRRIFIIYNILVLICIIRVVRLRGWVGGMYSTPEIQYFIWKIWSTNRSLESRRRLEHKFEVNLEGIECDNINWIHLALDKAMKLEAERGEESVAWS